MGANRRTAMFIGLLLLLGLGCGILSSVPVLEQPDYLQRLAEIEWQMLAATCFQAAMAVTYVGIAVLFYPILRTYNKSLAAGYLGFRIIGATFLFVGIGALLLLLWLSQSFAQNGQADYYFTLAELLRRGRDFVNHVGMILPWSIGGILLYYGLYTIRIIPQWLSLWGLAGSGLTLAATILLMLNIVPLVDPVYFLLNTPTALFELSFAIYLIVRGFNPIGITPSLKGGSL